MTQSGGKPTTCIGYQVPANHHIHFVVPAVQVSMLHS